MKKLCYNIMYKVDNSVNTKTYGEIYVFFKSKT